MVLHTQSLLSTEHRALCALQARKVMNITRKCTPNGPDLRGLTQWASRQERQECPIGFCRQLKCTRAPSEHEPSPAVARLVKLRCVAPHLEPKLLAQLVLRRPTFISRAGNGELTRLSNTAGLLASRRIASVSTRAHQTRVLHHAVHFTC